ncbi:hypothetical protein [Photorhabdus aegyptia]|nr:hypothetical protein [Photorhabdus aegyptia]
MSDRNLRLQVILNAVDKITRPFKSAQVSKKGWLKPFASRVSSSGS